MFSVKVNKDYYKTNIRLTELKEFNENLFNTRYVCEYNNWEWLKEKINNYYNKFSKDDCFVKTNILKWYLNSAK